MSDYNERVFSAMTHRMLNGQLVVVKEVREDYCRENHLFKRAAELIDQGADHLEKYGWTQRILYLNTAEACALGSLTFAAGTMKVLPGGTTSGPMPDDDTKEAVAVAQWKMESGVHELGYHNVPKWNDKGGQSAENVVSTMRGWAQELRERQDG